MIREKTIFRNILFGAALLAVGVASSCSVDETIRVSDGNAVTFKAVAPYATRAEATTTNNLSAFSVWGWNVDGNGNVTGTLINNETATNGGNGVYSTGKTHYWPGNAVDFLALSPVGVVSEETTGRVESLTYTVPESYAEQSDLCYALALGRTTGTVTLNFRHALSQIVFAALNSNSTMTVDIAGVKVASVVKEGVLTLPTVSTSYNLTTDTEGTDGIGEEGDKSQGTWTYEATETAACSAGLSLGTDGYVTLGSEAVTLTAADDGNGNGGSLFLITEETAAWDVLNDATDTNGGAYFLISCRISQFGVQLWPDPDGSVDFAEIAVPVDIAWEQGKKYTYTFYFGEGGGYYPPTETDAGTPILEGPIKFTVEVGDLDASAGSFDEDDEADSYIVVKTFDELTAAVSNNEHHIIVAADIDISKESNGHGVGIYTDCTIIIEDGCTITAPNSGSSSPYSAFYVEYVSEERGYPNLTIDGDGTIATTGDSAAAGTYCIYVREGDLTINSGNFKGGAWNVENYTGTDYCIYGYGYTGDVNVTINGGSFCTGAHTADLYANPNSSYTIDFTVNAGRFYMYDPSDYVASGHSATQDSEGWYVVK